MGLEVEIVPKNYNQFEVNISDVENSEFLNNKQKDYAINLLKAVEDNNFSELVQIKKSFKEDVIAYPELRIFNSGIALIEATQNYMNTNGAFGKNDCLHAAMVGGVMAGVYGMISGAITGGLSGLVIGGALTGGILAVPAGGAGAIAGATIEGFFGFVGGAILGYIGYLIFG